MSAIPALHVTEAELKTERFWTEHLDPIAVINGEPVPVTLRRDEGDEGAHLMLGPQGQLLAVVRTDRPACPTCGR